MKSLFFILVALLGALGCKPDTTAPPPNEFNLLHRFRELAPPGLTTKTSYCAPNPLPEVTYRVGEVMAPLSQEIRVPVYLDTGALPSYGGLLALEYDAKRLNPIRVEPGEAWAHADFVHVVDNVIETGRLIWLALGWELDNGAAVPLPAERLDQPFVYIVFEGLHHGKGKLVWDTVPEGATFHRRGEALVVADGCDWDVIDFYRSRPNSTGLMNVEPGYVVVVPR